MFTFSLWEAFDAQDTPPRLARANRFARVTADLTGHEAAPLIASLLQSLGRGNPHGLRSSAAHALGRSIQGLAKWQEADGAPRTVHLGYAAHYVRRVSR